MVLRNVPGLIRVAQVFGPAEASLVVAALEGAGFKIFVPGFHTLSNVQYLSVAFGGVPVMVERRRAAEAAAFLEALDHKNIEIVGPEQIDRDCRDGSAPKRRSLLYRLGMSAFYLFTGTAPALKGRFGTKPKD